MAVCPPEVRFFLFVAATLWASPVHAVDWEWNSNALPKFDKDVRRAAESYQRGDVDSAISIITQCKSQSQDDCRVRHILVDIYRENKRLQEAKSEMQELIAVEQRLNSVTATARPMWADVPQAKVELARLHEEDGDYSTAIKIYGEAQALSDVERQKNWMVPRMGMARCYEAQGEWGMAKQSYEQAMKDPYISTDLKKQFEQKLEEVDHRIAGHSGSSFSSEGPSGGGEAAPPEGSAGDSFGSTGSSSFSSEPIASVGGFGGSTSFGGSTPIRASAPPPSSSSAAPAKPRPVAVQQAIQEMNLKNYEGAAGMLKNYLVKNKTNAEAHYLLGVSYAFLKKNAEAAVEYEAAIEHANSIDLQKMAAAGLRKVQISK